MPLLRATYDYEVRRLLVSRNLLGASLGLQYDGYSVEIVLPVSGQQPQMLADEPVSDDLFPADDPPFPMQGGGAYVHTGIEITAPDEWATVGFLRVRVTGVADPDEDWLLFRLGDIADAVVRRTVEWLRVEQGQPHLGLGGERPDGIGIATLVDVEAHELLPITAGRSRPILRRVDASEALQPEALRRVLARVAANDEPPLADSLLADALYYFESDNHDLPRTVLSAAIACEVKVRDVLRAKVDPAARELLDVLLSNPRDWSLAAAALFHKPMKAVVGQSFADKSSDPSFSEVEKLFKLRNKVAHEGKRPTEDEAEAAVSTAVRAFRWLERALNDHPGDPR